MPFLHPFLFPFGNRPCEATSSPSVTFPLRQIARVTTVLEATSMQIFQRMAAIEEARTMGDKSPKNTAKTGKQKVVAKSAPKPAVEAKK